MVLLELYVGSGLNWEITSRAFSKSVFSWLQWILFMRQSFALVFCVKMDLGPRGRVARFWLRLRSTRNWSISGDDFKNFFNGQFVSVSYLLVLVSLEKYRYVDFLGDDFWWRFRIQYFRLVRQRKHVSVSLRRRLGYFRRFLRQGGPRSPVGRRVPALGGQQLLVVEGSEGGGDARSLTPMFCHPN